ncbi:DeoR/GlpR family DNA-binding transcription regulator [Jatrophihabitans telluris]|uniref:DeoR/GlpR family DNA-binding transcription regulator n=1 Tax=Jatrophihabitans telluris TaxID=2038343 RepID=A0ABY4R1C3_9ACTN|nr:DeoR/GlpR family DNA-binding transcription regulator [Jatrophihabitans telluris]UQX89112.1 DeoR/GlpR family DNA-binding transcription regulator [Jatrophihabitans telluris]
MLARQRQARILDEVRRAGGVRVSELTALLGVSDMTIRRDLDQLATEGSIQKVHGGAVLGHNVTEEPGFEAKSALAQPAKLAIATRAAQLISPGTAVAVSAGTTTWGLGRFVAEIPGLTVVTNSTTVADTISTGETKQTVILTGGVRTPSAALVGPVADATIRSLHVDQLFLGVHGMDARAGFTTPNLAEAETNRALISRAREVIVVADSSKWGTVGLADFGALSVADILITDDGLPNDARAAVSELVGELIIVSYAREESA